jgi:nucleoside-diphosphate-sugar epimerase
MSMLTDKRLLVTGPAGQIAFPLVQQLAQNNEVWGIARFGDTALRDKVEAAGCTTRVVDLGDPDWGDLPERFDHVLHLAIFQALEPDYDYAMRVNAEGTALLMHRFANSESMLIVSTAAVYDNNPDGAHRYLETDLLGDNRAPYSPTYGITKIAQEGVARGLARALGLPTTIARMNVSYSALGGLPAYQLDMVVNDIDVPVMTGGAWFNPIDEDDISMQVPKLLDVASVPATICNWGGDDAVSTEEYVTYLASLVGREARFVYTPEGIPGRAFDNTRREHLIGPCEVSWQEGFRKLAKGRYPDLYVGP